MSDDRKPVILIGAATARAADLHRLETENAKLKAALASIRASRNPHTLLSLEWGERIHGLRCVARTGVARHAVVLLNEDARSVLCRFCGETLDAFEVLHEFARDERRFNFTLEGGREEVARLVRNIGELTATRKNLMSAVARAKRMIRDGEAVAAAAIQAAARAEADAAEAAAAARAAAEEKLRNEPLLEPYKPGEEIPR